MNIFFYDYNFLSPMKYHVCTLGISLLEEVVYLSITIISLCISIMAAWTKFVNSQKENEIDLLLVFRCLSVPYVIMLVEFPIISICKTDNKNITEMLLNMTLNTCDNIPKKCWIQPTNKNMLNFVIIYKD